MRGDLSEMSAADACRELAGQGATGAFEVDGPDGPGRIVFREGRVHAAVSPTPHARLGDRLVAAGLLEDDDLTAVLGRQAESPGRRRLGALLVEEGLVSQSAIRHFAHEQVLDAVFEIVSWRYGAFRFFEGAADLADEVPLDLGVDETLVEVSRRQQEWEELSRLIPDLEAVPAFRTHPSSANASLEPEEFALLANVDGERSIRELAHELGFGEFEAARVVYGLALVGVVEIQLPEDEIGAAFDEAFAYFADTADEDEHADEHAVEDEDQPADEHADEHAVEDEVEHAVGNEVEDGSEPAAPAERADEQPAGTVDEAHEPAPADDEDEPAAPVEDEDEPAAAHQAEGSTPGAFDDDLGEILAALRDEPLPSRPGRAAAEPPAARAEPDTEVVEADLPWVEPPTPDAAEVAPTAEQIEEASTPDEVPEPAATAEPVAAPTAEPETAPTAEPEAAADDTEDTEDTTGPELVVPPRSGPAPGADVSEFLRELSRLAFDDAPATEQEPRPRPPSDDHPTRPAPAEDKRKKRRGLFGLGG